MKLIKQMLVYPTKPDAKLSNHVYLCTTNEIVKPNGELVMGGGNALAFAKAYPWAPRLFGDYVRHDLDNKTNNRVRVMSDTVLFFAFGYFCAKHHYKDPSPIELVKESIKQLTECATELNDYTFHLPYPAVGLGGLTVEELQPFMDELPDNVLVYLV